MKKKLLFVMPSLSAGGGEKSLINLLSKINYDQYNVDLYLFNETGLFLNSLPKEVNLLKCSKKRTNFTNHLPQSILYYLKKGQFNLALNRTIFSIKNRLIRSTARSEQYSWKNQKKSFNFSDEKYDAAIGYLEKSSIYFVVENVQAKKKIGWIHTNYSSSGMNLKHDYPYFVLLDKVVTVSEECAKDLGVNFPDIKNNIKIIHNIVSPLVINELSTKKIEDSTIFNKDYINIVSVARLSNEKGIDLAIKTCKLLIDNGHKIKWFVLGEGKARQELETLIHFYHLNESFELLGIKENPYPYIKQADIYVQPSRYEGRSIAIDEAKILQKPIVVTRFDTAKDQIKDRVTGIIAEMNPEDLAENIQYLLLNNILKNKLISNLANEKLGTEEEINKLYELL